MNAYVLVTVGCWAVFLGYWTYAAIGTKKNISNPSFTLSGTALRLVLFFVIAGIAAVAGNRLSFSRTPDPFFGTIGCILVIASIAFALWARFHLGRNWGMPMTGKQDRELVTSGPYAYVRHPIYTGVIVALIGSAAVSGGFWWLIALAGTVYFAIAALREESMLSEELPEGYPEYRRRTKMLIPFIW